MEQKCNIIPMPQTAHAPYMSPRDMELLLGGIVRLMKKYAEPAQIVEFVDTLQKIIDDDTIMRETNDSQSP